MKQTSGLRTSNGINKKEKQGLLCSCLRKERLSQLSWDVMLFACFFVLLEGVLLLYTFKSVES